MTGFFQNSRQVTVYDPKTKKFTTIDTCFGTHHLNFAEDANNTLWLSNNTGLGGAPVPELAVVGWINTKLFWQTGDAAKSQGWTPLIVDTNGNGKRDEGYNEPGQPPDYSKDTRHPLRHVRDRLFAGRQGSIWGSSLAHPGYIIRLDAGRNPPDTALAEIYKVPLPGFGIRGMDVDRNGVAWLPLDSGHIASFDRRKCKGPLNGPGAEKGEKCPEGFSFYAAAGAGLPGRSRRRGEPVLRVGRPAQHPGARRQCAVRDRQPVGFAARAGRRPDRRVARALSDGLFRQGSRRPHRRPERRLEGPRVVGDLGQPHALPHRGDRRPRARRAGRHAGDAVEPARRRVPAPPRPAGALIHIASAQDSNREPMARFLTFLVVVLLVVVEVMLSKLGTGTEIALQLWPTAVQISIPAALALAIAFALGLWSMLAGAALSRNLPSPAGWLVPAAVFLGGLMLIAAARGDMPLIRGVSVAGLGLAAAVAVCYALANTGLPRATLPSAQIGGVGVIALLAASALLADTILLRVALAVCFAVAALGVAYYTFTEFRAGHLVETESRFGGLGGGLGGWRISSAACLLLLTVVLTGAAVALATYSTNPGTTTRARDETPPGASRPAPSAADKKRRGFRRGRRLRKNPDRWLFG